MQNICLESHNIDNLYFGFGQFNYNLIKSFASQNVALNEWDFNLTLISKNPDKLKEEFGNKFNYIKYHSLLRKRPFRIRKKYDLWHSLNQNTKVEPYYKIPYLLTVHDVNFMEENIGSKLQKRKQLFEAKLKRSQAITYISNYAKEMTHKYFEVPNIKEYVIYNGSSEKIGIPENHEPEFKPTRPFLFTIGELLEKKNFHTLVYMMVNLPEINLVISGKSSTTYADTIRDIIRELNLEDRVKLTGKISELDKAYYLKNCYAFCFPSLREGFGIPPIEAMSYGKPVFLSNKSSLPEVGGKHAFYWDNFEPEYMAKILQNGMIEFKNTKSTFEANLIAHANSYSWDKTAKAYLDVYKSLLK